MLVQKATPPDKKEKLIKLGEVKPGSGKVVRFPGISYEEALVGKDEATFYQVIKVQQEKKGRVTLVSIDGTLVLEKDDDHMVITHNAVLSVSPAELI